MTPLRLSDTKQHPPFEWRWPEGPPEKFDSGIEGAVLAGDKRRRFLIGFGERRVYDASRAHVVVWLDGEVMVEGTGEDDLPRSKRLVSLIKRADGKLARAPNEVPSELSDLEIVDHRTAIDVPYSRNALAIRAAREDTEAWVRHAVVRWEQKHAKPKLAKPQTPKPHSAIAPTKTSSPAASLTDGQLNDLVRLLLSLNLTESKREPGELPEFTPDPRANQLVVRDPFAFLLAVIFDQGIVAEQAWAAPYALRQRLGHLDPARIAKSPAGVSRAINERPMLHRYKNKMARWVVDAGQRVIEEYGGDAGRIWAGTPSVPLVHERLSAFTGIGQKKSTMAVEILERDLGVPFTDLHESQPAYDIHIRRVFLRSGLADEDDVAAIRAAARRAYPERPGALDFPAWKVGRAWCHRTEPECGACALRSACLKRTELGVNVRGQ